jgi:N-acetylglutamate synthase-like GNAT family acetyltransferase
MKINEIHFRSAEIHDAESITRLVNSVYRGENSKKGWTTEADLLEGIRITTEKIEEIINSPDDVIIVAELNNEMPGCVNLTKMKNQCMLGMLSVDVNLQNSGIGRKIIEYSEDFAKNTWGCNEMVMKVIGVRKELIEYYQRRGYKISGKKEPFTLNHHFGKPQRNDLYFIYMTKKL